MKRQQRTTGAILEIPIDNAYYCYAQILHEGCAFFDIKSNIRLSSLELLRSIPVLFIVEVYNDVITQGHWLKVGKLEIREDLKVLPLQYIQDALDPTRFSLYDPNTGVMYPATKEECRGLEVCAVWDKHHVEERLSDHYAGRPNFWIEESRKKFDR